MTQIRKLEWTEHQDKTEEISFWADHQFGSYAIERDYFSVVPWELLAGGRVIGNFNTIEMAQKAAQDHFEQRVLLCFDRARPAAFYDPTTQSYDEPLTYVDQPAMCRECGRMRSDTFDYIRLGARAMRRAAEADCGNHSEGAQEDAMTSGGLTKTDRMKLAAEVDAADEIRRAIENTCEDSALGYASYMGSEEDKAALKDLGVTPDWLYRRQNNVPSRLETSKAAASKIADTTVTQTSNPRATPEGK